MILCKQHYLKIVTTTSFLLIFTVNSKASEDISPPKTGNFILPVSQQPAPLIGFGENIIDKNEKVFYLFADDLVGNQKHLTEVAFTALYGISENVALLLYIPYATSFKMNQKKSKGITDSDVQLEYAFYNKSTFQYVDQATIVTNVSFPTGSIHKNPPTGFGSPSFFLGATYNRTYSDWFYFGSPGVQLTSSKDNTQDGNNYLYQLGLGKNMFDHKGWIFAWMTEFDGIYSQKNRIQGVMDPNSGGNVIYITPSFWASSKEFLLQLGVGFPVVQDLYGTQPKSYYLLVANLAWSFY